MKLKTKYVLGLFYMVSALTVYSQVATLYTFSQTIGAYTSISGGTVLGTTASDDELFLTNTTGNPASQTAAGFPIGFTFNYNGTAFTQFGVSTNGYITLGNLPSFTMPSNPCNCFGNAPSGTINVNNGIALFANGNIISCLNYDLVGQAGSTLQCLTTGSSPNRILTVQWSGFASYGLAGDNYNCQIKLYESLDKIQLCYGTFTHDGTLEDTRVGLYGATNADFFMRTSSTNWTATTNGASNGASIAFNNAVLPTNGLIFEYQLTASLPIELLSFNAVQEYEKVKLSWVTATEINNDHFTIEKSRDGIHFTKYKDIRSAGNSNSLKKYDEMDYEPYTGISYYRLKQTDRDGAFKYFPLVSVEFKENKSITVFPNPADSKDINIKLSGYKNQEVVIIMRDMQGRGIYSKTLLVESDCEIFVIDSLKTIPTGSYVILVSSSDKVSYQKLMIK